MCIVFSLSPLSPSKISHWPYANSRCCYRPNERCDVSYKTTTTIAQFATTWTTLSSPPQMAAMITCTVLSLKWKTRLRERLPRQEGTRSRITQPIAQLFDRPVWYLLGSLNWTDLPWQFGRMNRRFWATLAAELFTGKHCDKRATEEGIYVGDKAPNLPSLKRKCFGFGVFQREIFSFIKVEVQIPPLTVTPLGHGESVTVTRLSL